MDVKANLLYGYLAGMSGGFGLVVGLGLGLFLLNPSGLKKASVFENPKG
jgi:hypothetical protein